MDNHEATALIRFLPRKREQGMALVMVLLLLLLVSAIGLGLVFMANTETSINGNFRDSQLAFFAMRAGIDEARDRMRTNSPWSVTLPTTMPGSPNSIVYITNPASSSDTVDPASATNPYFDDEFCHETFSGVALTAPPPGVPCTAGPPSSSIAPYIASISPNSASGATSYNSPALKYKWVRITLKQNATFANGNPAAYVDPSQSPSTQICYQSMAGQQVPLTSVPGGPWASCALAQQGGQDASPVFVVTSLAVTPTGSRRMGQSEMASLMASGPPVALGLDGPAAVYNPVASSNALFMNGTDNNNHYANPPGCTSSGYTVPAITVGDAAGVNNVTTALQGPPDRSSHYSGCTNTASPCTIGAPSVVDGSSTSFSGTWSTPSQLDNMVQSLANVADSTYTCGIGTPCSPTGALGTDSNPQITYVNGDFNYGNASGAGILIVTGTLSFNGNAKFDGLILVIGQGAMVESGGGNGGFNGSVFLAKTRSSTPPYAELPTLGTPTISWNGGGNSFIQYNSCWATVGKGSRYLPISMREEMY